MVTQSHNLTRKNKDKMQKKTPYLRQFKSSEQGSMFTILMGAIGLVAMTSLAAYSLITGPLSSASRVTQNNLVKSQLGTIASITAMDAASQTATGDCDTDGYIEPRPWRDPSGAPAPVNGGLIPVGMGAPTVDPWGLDYGYCVWDVGAVSGNISCGSGTGMLDGANDPATGNTNTQTVIAIISAGPDRQFQTTCNDYVDTSTDLITTSGDDIVKRHSYTEASSSTSSLWSLKTGDSSTAEIDKNLAIGNDINFTTGSGLIQALAVNATGKVTVGGAFSLGTTADGSCTPTTAGMLRYNGSIDEAQLCLDDGSWGYASSFPVTTFPILAPDAAVGAPSYSFRNASDSGVFHDATGLSVHSSPSGRVAFNRTGSTDFRVVSKGSIKISNTTEACNTDSEGTLHHVPVTKSLIFCNGDEWEGIFADNMASASVAHPWDSCAIRADGTAWCWGGGDYGRLGYGGTDGQSLPIQVDSPGTWKTINAEGAYFTCGIKSDDTGWCWGSGYLYKLGNGSHDGQLTPGEINGGHSWKTLDGGSSYTCGIKTDNTAWCWGQGDYGKLGNGDTNTKSSLTEISGSSTWTSINTGDEHTCGIKTDGTAWCWGNGGNGRLGNGGTANSSVPVEVSGGSTWKYIDTAKSHSCGIKTDDSAWCWGAASFGRLGNGDDTTDQLTPVEVMGSDKWEMISPGGAFTCGLKLDGSVWCWGAGYQGKLGGGSGSDSLTPVRVVSGDKWNMVSSGYAHSCATKVNGSVWCWGAGGLGVGGGDSDIPVKALD